MSAPTPAELAIGIVSARLGPRSADRDAAELAIVTDVIQTPGAIERTLEVVGILADLVCWQVNERAETEDRDPEALWSELSTEARTFLE